MSQLQNYRRLIISCLSLISLTFLGTWFYTNTNTNLVLANEIGPYCSASNELKTFYTQAKSLPEPERSYLALDLINQNDFQFPPNSNTIRNMIKYEESLGEACNFNPSVPEQSNCACIRLAEYVQRFDTVNNGQLDFHCGFINLNRGGNLNLRDLLKNNSSEAKSEEQLISWYQACRDNAKTYEKSQTQTPLTPQVPSPPNTKHPSPQDFEDMSRVFVPYASEVLNACRDVNKSPVAQERCRLAESASTKQRLAFLMSIVTHGSHGVRNFYLDTPFTNLSDSANGYTCLADSNCPNGYTSVVSCPTFSDTSSFLPMVQYIKSTIDPSSDRNRFDLICQTTITPLAGVENLINICRNTDQVSNISDCRKVLGKSDNNGFLNPQRTQAYQLQTMYWNMVDVPATPDQAAITSWITLSDQERQDMQKIIDNPLGITEPSIQSIGATAASNLDFAGKCLSSIGNGAAWLVCSITSMMIDAVSGNFKIIYETISSQNAILASDQILEIWRSFLNIANVIFIIIFLVIIASQISNLGIKNYGIKTILPKLIVAVILANISLFAVKILFDVSALVGHNIFSILTPSNKPDFLQSFSAAGIGNSLFGDVGTVLISILLLLITLLAWLIIMIVQVVLLALRATAMVLLVVLAPLAVILYTLPNTSRLTKVWWQALLGVVLLQPLLALLYSSGIMAYSLAGGATGSQYFFRGLIARSMIVLPMILSPFATFAIFKRLPILGTSLARITARVGQWLRPDPNSEKSKQRAAKLKQVDDQVHAGVYSGLRPIRRFKSAAFRKLGSKPLFARGTAQAWQSINKNRDQRSELLPAPVAQALISDLSSRNRGAPPKAAYEKLSNYHQTLYRQFATDKVNLSNKDLAMEASLAYVKSSIETSGVVDGVTILQQLNVARSLGASQAELSNLHQQISSQLETNDQYVASAELYANAQFYEQEFGNFDAQLYSDTLPSAGGPDLISKHQHLTELRKAEIAYAFINNLVNRESALGDEHKLILKADMFPAGSISERVLSDQLSSHRELYEAITFNMSKFDATTQKRLQQILPPSHPI